MPLQRRLPKFGFRSPIAAGVEDIRLTQLERLEAVEIDFELLQALGIIRHTTHAVKVYKDGKIKKAMTIKGLRVTKGVKAAVEAAGGKIEG
jgi:large subunit ribosomal protein L15